MSVLALGVLRVVLLDKRLVCFEDLQALLVLLLALVLLFKLLHPRLKVFTDRGIHHRRCCLLLVGGGGLLRRLCVVHL